MNSNTSLSPKVDVYAIVTNRIIELLEQGTIPWQKPWNEAGLPINLLSKRPYRGINVWLLASLNYSQNLFLTWDQLKKIGGSVKQGEHGQVVVFWKAVKKNAAFIESDIENKNQKGYSILRYYKVFNLEQCKDIPKEIIPEVIESTNDSIVECEAIVSKMPDSPLVVFAKQQPSYRVEKDTINMPKMKSFKSSQSYYSTLFHELVHSTGHEKRLNRKTITEMAEFGAESYSIEELIAELGTCYLCNIAGILNTEIKNSAAYIEGWLKQLKNDKRFIVFASTYAQKAVDYILNLQQPVILDEIEQSELLT